MDDLSSSDHGAGGFVAAWASLGSELEFDPEFSRAVGLDLAARHSEPHRHYHTTAHIEAVLGHLDHLHAATPVARLAAFFHDAVYEPRRADNEERSAELALEVLGGLGASDAGDVAAVVLATRVHTMPHDGPQETAAFLDADLAILGARPSVYDQYVAAIRAEYSHVPDDEFRHRRRAVLNGFVERKSLYFTSAGQVSWEVQGRANLLRELADLGA